ncbi:MAG: VWA domain-containing protein [Acidobacteria bacterium]|nr:VWA domain-containing protein [Acidobacteriota bacterium]
MKSTRFIPAFIIALLLASLLGLTALAQSGRRPTYPGPTNSPSTADRTGTSSTTSNGGSCPQVRFPGEYDGLPARTTSSSSSSSASSDPNAEEILKIDTTLVTIPVTVLDRSGKFIPYLTRCDFHLYEDNVLQEVAEFSAVETPFNVVLLLDTSNSTSFKIEDIHDAAIAFTNQLRPKDRVMVVSFDSKIRVHSEFTSDREQLRQAIRETHNGGSTRLYDAVEEVITKYLNPIQGRKAIVLYTDGVDTSSRRATDRSTIELVEESDVLVYPIEYDTFDRMGGMGGGYPPNSRSPLPDIFGIPRGRTPYPPTRRRWPLGSWAVPPAPQIQIGRGQGAGDYERAARYLNDLATHSGGTLYKGDSIVGISSAFAKIAEELRQQYAVSYYPTNSSQDGSYRRLKVRVSQTGWVVKAKEGYRAQGKASPSSATDSTDSSDRPVLRRKTP